MSDALPVVRIVSDEPGHVDGFVEINESDFDPKRHVLFDAKPVKPAKPVKRSQSDTTENEE